MAQNTATLSSLIEQSDQLLAEQADLSALKAAVEETLLQLDQGQLRVAEKKDNQWVTHQWIKKAILLSFRFSENHVYADGHTHYFDKVPAKFANYDATQFAAAGCRVVPNAQVRQGSYIAPQTVLMPSFVNIGAYVDTGCMVDTWATIGSCAQIGKNVHISGGAGIGGVLEPLQANPTIIEDNCFIGARSEIVEGVRVAENAVISMGVFIGQSTPIYNRMTKEITYGLVPEGAVVIPGNLPDQSGEYSRYAAIIMKQVDAKTRSKVSINELLRS